MPNTYQFAFWNLENLFDIERSPRRSEKLERAIGRDLKGWTQALLDRKVAQLASIIQKMNSGQGPDILGVCEIENEHVVRLLAQALAPLGRSYDVVHADTNDQRGIDVAFIYDRNRFTAGLHFSHFVMRRTATRDLLQVNFTTSAGRPFVLIGNHWPSRSGGEAESAVYRAVAGETLAYFHQRILEELGENTPVMAMGDFNDEPPDPSLVDYALSLRSRTKVVNARTAQFFNVMWPLMGRGLGSFYFDNFPNMLDQFLVNRRLLVGSSPLRVVAESAAIEAFPEMVTPGDYPRPIPFGGIGREVNQNGYSDHFPISITVQEAD